MRLLAQVGYLLSKQNLIGYTNYFNSDPQHLNSKCNRFFSFSRIMSIVFLVLGAYSTIGSVSTVHLKLIHKSMGTGTFLAVLRSSLFVCSFILHGPSWTTQRTSIIVVRAGTALAPSGQWEAGQFTHGPLGQCSRDVSRKRF